MSTTPPSRLARLRRVDGVVRRVLRRLDDSDLPFFRVMPETVKRRFAKSLLRVVPSLWRDRPLEVNGFALRVPPNLRRRYFDGSYEPEVTAVLHEILEPGMTAVDVGANIGALSVAMARLVGPEGRVIAFEPVASTYRYLRENLSLNKLTNVQACRYAVGEQRGTAEIYFEPCSSESSLFKASLTQRAEVDVVRLDDVLPARVHLVKVDVEGAELSVIRGLRRTLENNPELHLIVEWHPRRQLEAGLDVFQLPREILALGLTMAVVEAPKVVACDEGDLSRIKHALDEAGGGWINLYCTRMLSAATSSV